LSGAGVGHTASFFSIDTVVAAYERIYATIFTLEEARKQDGGRVSKP
jgi:hypothetical protein